MITSGHPEGQRLADYAAGKIPQEEAVDVATHLSVCPECEATVQLLEAKSDTIVGGLRQAAPAEPYAGETELRQALANVANLPAEAKLPAAPSAVSTEKASTKGPVKLGPYQLLAKLGEGGMGAVFKARHEHLDKIVAVKVLPKKAMSDPAAVARFRREMKAVGALHHPNIVGAHDAGEAQGVHFLVMEYVEGSDLSSLIKKNGPVTVEQAVSYVRQAAQGLAFAHAKNIVHRDIKPANLLVDNNGAVKILDMGLARLDDGGAANAEANQGLTQTGQVMGTVDYMAPEQAFDTHRADAKADVYSLGCTLYRILTGQNAYSGDTIVQKILAHREQSIPSLTKSCPTAPAALDAIYQRMMAKRPEDRPTMAEVMKELDAVANPQAVAESAPSIVIEVQKSPVAKKPEPAKKPVSREAQPSGSNRRAKPPVQLIAGGIGGFALFLAFGIWLIVNRPDGTEEKIEIAPGSTITVQANNAATAPHIANVEPVAPSVTSSATTQPTEYQGKRYQVFKNVVSWQQARDNCTAQHGHLAIVRTAAEQAFLVALLKSANMDAAWIGASDERKEGDWTWIDGTKVTFADWDKGQPNNKPPGEHYAAIVLNYQGTWLNGRWSDQPAKSAQHPTIGYVCQWDASPGDYALQFDGVAEYVEIPTLSRDNEGPYTIEAFVTPARHGLGDTLYQQFLHVGGRYWTDLGQSDTRWAYNVNTAKGGMKQTDSISPVQLHQRVHVAGIWNGTEGLFFLEGKLRFRSALNNGLMPAYKSCTVLGALFPTQTSPANQHFFAGVVDEVRISKTARYTADFKVAARFETDADTLALYHFDEAAGDVLHDASGHGHDGKIVGAKWVRADGSPLTFGIGSPDSSPAAKPAFADPAFQAWLKATQALPVDQQTAAVSKKLMELNPGFDGKVSSWKDANGDIGRVYFDTDNVTDLAPIRAFTKLTTLRSCGTAIGKGRLADLSPLKGMQLTILDCSFSKVADLSPLEGMPLTSLKCGISAVSDLSPLRGMPLTFLNCSSSPVADLSPLAGMPLGHLDCYGTKVPDLAPLRGMTTLTNLTVLFTPVTDLSPLQGMNLTSAAVSPQNITAGMDVLRDMKSLTIIAPKAGLNLKADEFWQRYDAGEFGKPGLPVRQAPEFEQWVKATQALPADQQLEAVSKKLMELNPGFDGKLMGYRGPAGDAGSEAPKVEKGVVTYMGLITDQVSDVSPLRALRGLQGLNCSGGPKKKGLLTDLSPLTGLPLTTLGVDGNANLSDLSSLQKTQLTSFSANYTAITEKSLQQLQGLPLKYLHAGGARLTDLSFLKGMPLEILYARGSFADLSPLRGMPLRHLSLSQGSQVTDLSPLKGMGLTMLNLEEAPLSDLSPLVHCPDLKVVTVKKTKVTAEQVAALQKALPACKIEWDDPAKLASAKLAYLDPAFELWVAATQKLPAEQQLEAVSKKLKELNPDFDGAIEKRMENRVVDFLSINGAGIVDVSPVRALVGLRTLHCPGTAGLRSGTIRDLSPLTGKKLTELDIRENPVSDFSPLVGMPLVKLTCDRAEVADLSPLRGMPLEVLRVSNTKARSLEALRGMPLKTLEVSEAADLAPLEGMPLEHLSLSLLKTADLAPLAGMPLVELRCHNSPILTDASLAVLQGKKTLTALNLDGNAGITDGALPVLESLTGLATLNVTKTKITAAGLDRLEKALPNCEIITR